MMPPAISPVSSRSTTATAMPTVIVRANRLPPSALLQRARDGRAAATVIADAPDKRSFRHALGDALEERPSAKPGHRRQRPAIEPAAPRGAPQPEGAAEQQDL